MAWKLTSTLFSGFPIKHPALWILLATITAPLTATAQNKVETPPPTSPPLVAADPAALPEGYARLDLYLLIGQSNMKGRGFMPAEAKNDPRLLMMHLRDDQWYRARHPLHLTGDAKTFQGHDNAGVGPGLAFAEAIIAGEPEAAIEPPLSPAFRWGGCGRVEKANPYQFDHGADLGHDSRD